MIKISTSSFLSVLIFSRVLFLANEVSAQISIGGNGFTYSQNFNTLSSTSGSHTWTNNSTLPGWYAANLVNGLVGNYQTDDGSSTICPTLYSFGTSSSSDRALGSLNRNVDGDVVYGALFQNNIARQINSIT